MEVLHTEIKNVLLVNGLYCYILVMLINGKSPKNTLSCIKKEINEGDNEDVKKWLEDSHSEEVPKIKDQMGWIRHAFVLCLRYLRIADTKESLDHTFYEECKKA